MLRVGDLSDSFSALFFHRYMLRKLGLWKESTGAYEINPSTAPLDNSVTTSSLPDGSQADVCFILLKFLYSLFGEVNDSTYIWGN